MRILNPKILPSHWCHQRIWTLWVIWVYRRTSLWIDSLNKTWNWIAYFLHIKVHNTVWKNQKLLSDKNNFVKLIYNEILISWLRLFQGIFVDSFWEWNFVNSTLCGALCMERISLYSFENVWFRISNDLLFKIPSSSLHPKAKERKLKHIENARPTTYFFAMCLLCYIFSLTSV